jgi:ArsR family transcriptional regulator
MAGEPDVSDPVNRMFRAFSDRTRLRMLNLLRGGELCVGDMVSALGVPQPTASRHLAYLRKSGLVVVRREGLWKYYALAPATSEFQSDSARAAGLKDGGCCPEKAAGPKPKK